MTGYAKFLTVLGLESAAVLLLAVLIMGVA